MTALGHDRCLLGDAQLQRRRREAWRNARFCRVVYYVVAMGTRLVNSVSGYFNVITSLESLEQVSRDSRKTLLPTNPLVMRGSTPHELLGLLTYYVQARLLIITNFNRRLYPGFFQRSSLRSRN